MSLPKLIEYNDLTGEEAKQILAARFWQYLESIPEMQQRFALTRVKFRMELVMDIWGSASPRKILQDEVEIKADHTKQRETFVRTMTKVDEVVEVDTFSNPPDQVREDYGLPVPRGQRNPAGIMETAHVVLEGSTAVFPPAPKPEELKERIKKQPLPPTPATLASPTMGNVIMGHTQRKPYASVVELDHGSIQRGERGAAPVIGDEKFAEHLAVGPGKADVPPQFDFVHSPERTGKDYTHETLSERAAREARDK